MSPTYTPLFEELMRTHTRFVINMGGTGSGKSFAAAQKEIVKATRHADTKTLVIRKVGSTLRDSVIPSFRSRLREFGLAEVYNYSKTGQVLSHKQNGSEIIFRGLDDPEKLKSFEGLQRILVEEASELEYEDFLELNRRVRGREDIQITLCFNPIDEEHWLKKHFIDQQVEDCTILHSTYKDNPYLTDKDREQIEWMRRYSHNQYRIYALGEWGMKHNATPWLFAFARHRHVAPTLQYMPSYPVYLSFDFNREPVSCVAVQMSPLRGRRDSFVNIIREFAADVQLGELCAMIRAAYPAAILFVTGDASGNRGDIGFDSRHSTYYQMIRSYLQLNERQLLLNTRNMEHGDSRLLINTLFENYPHIRISEEHCPRLINDCIIATTDENSQRPGTLKKDRGIYKMDLFDAMRYFFQACFKDYAGDVSVGKL